MRAVKYGVTTNYVMGLEVVLADGTILTLGGKAIKNVTGYDLKSLFTGSEGTLGIITRVTLRLISMPKRRGTLQVMFRSLDDGCATIHRMLQAGVVPAAAEIMDRVCLEAVARHRKTALDEAVQACIVIEIDGDSDEDLAAQAGRIETVANQCGAIRFRVARSQQESDEIWAVRRGLSSAVAALAPDRLGEDISVPRDAFPEVVRRIRAISEKYRLPIAVYGHAGDGNLHPSVLCNMNDPEEAERVHRAVDEIFTAALAVGGTLSGEHGIGITKRPYIARALGEAGVKTLMAVKTALDPKGILESRQDLVDGFGKRPYAALRFIPRRCGVRQKYASLLGTRAPCLWTFCEAVNRHIQDYRTAHMKDNREAGGMPKTADGGIAPKCEADRQPVRPLRHLPAGVSAFRSEGRREVECAGEECDRPGSSPRAASSRRRRCSPRSISACSAGPVPRTVRAGSRPTRR